MQLPELLLSYSGLRLGMWQIMTHSYKGMNQQAPKHKSKNAYLTATECRQLKEHWHDDKLTGHTHNQSMSQVLSKYSQASAYIQRQTHMALDAHRACLDWRASAPCSPGTQVLSTHWASVHPACIASELRLLSGSQQCCRPWILAEAGTGS